MAISSWFIHRKTVIFHSGVSLSEGICFMIYKPQPWDAATLGIGALRGIAPPGAGDAAQRSAEAPPKALAMPRIMPPDLVSYCFLDKCERYIYMYKN